MAVVALTLGIGLVIFSLSVINCIFFGKLPFPDSNRLVYTSIAREAFDDFQQQQTSFEGLSAFSSATVNFKALNAPSRRRVCFIGANFLQEVRATTLLGRSFLPGEDRPGAEPVALIGYDLWQQEFNGSSTAVGSIIRVDGQPRTVVGIMPKGFKFPNDGPQIRMKDVIFFAEQTCLEKKVSVNDNVAFTPDHKRSLYPGGEEAALYVRRDA